MRSIIAGALFTLAAVSTAHAEIAEGKIASVDTDKLTITLDGGGTFKLSNEFDFTVLKEGVEVYLAYDEINGENVVTDMDISESE